MKIRQSSIYGQLVKSSVNALARITGREHHLMHYQMKWFATKTLGWSTDLVESCLPLEKQQALLDCVTRVRDVPGDIVECGVYRAGGTMLMAGVLQEQFSQKHIYGFDSFEGMPAAVEQDALQDGRRVYDSGVLGSTSIELVTEKAGRFGHKDRVRFHKGYFQDTLPKVFSSDMRFSLALIDCDQYAGTKFCLEFLYDKINLGGMILFDDYDSPDDLDTPGVKKAVVQFMHDKPEMGHIHQLELTLYGFVKS